MKADYNGIGNYEEEDLAYVEFKRYELKADLYEAIEANNLNSLWAYPLYYFKLLVFDIMGLYATNPFRVMVSMTVVFCLFSISYTILPHFFDADIICSGADNNKFHYVFLAFYYSAITFLTIGYGDCLPEGHIKWLAPMEGWMGMFLMAYFTVAFVRKILR